MEAMNKIMHSSNTSHSLLNEFTINMYKDKLSRPRLEVRPFTLGSTTIIKVKRRKNQTKHDPPPVSLRSICPNWIPKTKSGPL